MNMKKTFKFFSLLLVLALSSCNGDDETVVIPLYIIGEWTMIGQYQEGVYTEGVDCNQVETFSFDENKTGVAYETDCNSPFSTFNYPLERRKLADGVHQIIFPNGGPWLTFDGEITTGTIVDGKMHLETYDYLDKDKPNRSSTIVVYEKQIPTE